MTYSVSVVIPNYNRQEPLLRAIDSVLEQTYLPTEILVVDDASDFSVEEYLKERGYLDGPLLRVTRNPVNRGLSASRNLAFQQTSGQLIALLDSDDWWHPDKLQQQIRLFEEDPTLDLVATRDWIVKEHQTKERSLPFYSDQLFDRLITDWAPPVPSTVVAKRAVYERTPYQESVRYQVDTDWWLSFALTEPRIARVDCPLAYYYAGDNDRLSGAYYVERFQKIESFIARWRDKIIALRGEAQFQIFRKRILSYNAIDAFVEQYHRKNLPVAFQLYTKYLWSEKSFYQLLAHKIMPQVVQENVQ
ncbi:MAG: glycosyltransferase family 2 protein [Tunicatimonas sp.]